MRRERVETKGQGNGIRYRTVGSYQCYRDGVPISDPELAGASVEPRGPGDNGTTGKAKARRIEEGTYPLGTHFGTKYAISNYNKWDKPRPGVYVHDTNERSAILIHMGNGFKASIGCINLTGSIVGPHDMIGPNTSFARMDALIKYLKSSHSGYPSDGSGRIADAWLVIEGEPD